MRLLLDTHILLWSFRDLARLPKETREIIEGPENNVLFSAASIWEIAIKYRLGRVDFPLRPEVVAKTARETGFVELPVHATVAARVVDLPLHHRDPFDRLLVAQAMAEPVRLFTADPILRMYSELVEVVA
jgi:PIN domain nuclease of toxin-antitoxin system